MKNTVSNKLYHWFLGPKVLNIKKSGRHSFRVFQPPVFTIPFIYQSTNVSHSENQIALLIKNLGRNSNNHLWTVVQASDKAHMPLKLVIKLICLLFFIRRVIYCIKCLSNFIREWEWIKLNVVIFFT